MGFSVYREPFLRLSGTPAPSIRNLFSVYREPGVSQSPRLTWLPEDFSSLKQLLKHLFKTAFKTQTSCWQPESGLSLSTRYPKTRKPLESLLRASCKLPATLAIPDSFSTRSEAYRAFERVFQRGFKGVFQLFSSSTTSRASFRRSIMTMSLTKSSKVGHEIPTRSRKRL